MIRVETKNAVVSITLARPAQRNAQTPGMLDALADAFERIPATARAVVLSGDGKVFCAGFDLKLCAADPSGVVMAGLLTRLSRCVAVMHGLAQPIVAAAHGAAIAGGCALLCGADIVVADRGTRLGYPVVKIGVSPAVNAPFVVTKTTDGAGRALMLDPALIDAGQALRMGLVHELADSPDAARARAFEIARVLAAKPGIGVATTKALCNELVGRQTALTGPALEASLSRVGSDEERTRLAALWS